MSGNRWFVLACVGVAGVLVVGATATRFKVITPHEGRPHLVDNWTGRVYWVWNDALYEAKPEAADTQKTRN